MMSRLLRNSHPLVIDPELACMIGLHESIVLQQIHYWLEMNRKTRKNFRDGFYWTYNSYPNWQKQFPFWHVDTIKGIITKLERRELLISSSEYNELKIDRTKWYRINYEKLNALELVSGNGQETFPSSSGKISPMGEFTDSKSLDEETMRLMMADYTVAKISKKRNGKRAIQ